jgi:hypothetical protein
MIRKKKDTEEKKLLRTIEHEGIAIIIISVLSLIFSFLSWLNTIPHK